MPEQSANHNPQIRSSIPASTTPTSRPPKSRLWTYLTILAFLVAGVLVAVQTINPNDRDVKEFEQLEISTAADGNISDATDDQDLAVKGVDDLSGRLASMVDNDLIAEADHPLEPVLALAAEGARRMDQQIKDYTATIVSQVTIGRNLQPEKRIFCKIRHPKTVAAGSALPSEEVPFSIYLKMLAPESIAGQEVIWDQGQNDGKLVGHTTGFLNVKRAYLDPTGSLAMQGNLHPIFDIGFLNLVRKMGEVGRRDLENPDCDVIVTRDVTVNDRTCTEIEIKHARQDANFEFHIAKIYIDQRRDLLVGYESFLWPKEEGAPPMLKEKYFYTDVKINVGLRDDDFSPDNKDYDFPAW